MPPQPELRASDAERERTVEQLRAHALAGRLTVDELDERCARAYGALTVGELAELVVDLPATTRTVPAGSSCRSCAYRCLAYPRC